MEAIRIVLVVSHFIGLAAIIGPFLFQVSRKTGFELQVMLGGAIVQLVTGLALVGLAEAADRDMDYVRITVKLVVAVLVLALLLLARMRRRRLLVSGESDRGILPLFHSAGALAIVNVIVAVGWS